MQGTIITVDQAIGDQKGLHAMFGHHHVLADIVADHQAVGSFNAQFIQHLHVVVPVRLCMPVGLIGGDQRELVCTQTCPPNPCLGALSGKERAGGKGHPVSFFFRCFHNPMGKR